MLARSSTLCLSIPLTLNYVSKAEIGDVSSCLHKGLGKEKIKDFMVKPGEACISSYAKYKDKLLIIFFEGLGSTRTKYITKFNLFSELETNDKSGVF